MASEIISAEMVVALTGTIGVLGAGCKFAWNAIAKKIRDSEVRLEAERVRHELKIETERLKYEAVVADQIREMRKEMSQQEREINYLRRVSDAYLRHISVLEQLMRQAGIEIPILDLPDFPSSDGDV
ncbi:hypothetical protein [Aurantimonas coralicida]|uniref:hypothetical protein n=1 Tax=Aurantimonas coralicida TaxID=182270 RepID=UPI0003F97DF2|nr:hypothetical protein [Aurantimonas coralicida]MCC4298457.1 hypothetical protein [Aurantimonas coralicida]